MLASTGPVIADIAVDQKENCFPMIPSGAAHNDMILGPEHEGARGRDRRRRPGAGLIAMPNPGCDTTHSAPRTISVLVENEPGSWRA